MGVLHGKRCNSVKILPDRVEIGIRIPISSEGSPNDPKHLFHIFIKGKAVAGQKARRRVVVQASALGPGQLRMI